MSNANSIRHAELTLHAQVRKQMHKPMCMCCCMPAGRGFGSVDD